MLEFWIDIEKEAEEKIGYPTIPKFLDFNTVEPWFAGEPRITGQEPADQIYHYISLLQKPRFTGHKTPIVGIFFKELRKMSWFSS